MTTSTPTIVKGSTFVLSTGTTEMKSIIVEDPSTTVGEAATVKRVASDGTPYTTTGDTGDNGLSLTLLQTLEEFTNIMTFAYGAPTVAGDVSTWDLSTPSTTAGTITITSPITSLQTIAWQLVEAKALSVTPGMPLGDFNLITLNVTGTNWKAILDETA